MTLKISETIPESTRRDCFSRGIWTPSHMTLARPPLELHLNQKRLTPAGTPAESAASVVRGNSPLQQVRWNSLVSSSLAKWKPRGDVAYAYRWPFRDQCWILHYNASNFISRSFVWGLLANTVREHCSYSWACELVAGEKCPPLLSGLAFLSPGFQHEDKGLLTWSGERKAWYTRWHLKDSACLALQSAVCKYCGGGIQVRKKNNLNETTVLVWKHLGTSGYEEI